MGPWFHLFLHRLAFAGEPNDAGRGTIYIRVFESFPLYSAFDPTT
jgi:hypothetical protein